MQKQDMFPCSAPIKYKKSNIFDNKPSKRNKTGSSNLANCYSFLEWLKCSQTSERGDSYIFNLSSLYQQYTLMFSAKVHDFLESRTLSGESPSDLEWQGFPTPQPGKTKYSSLSQISLRINKKSNVTLLVPLNPLVTSPNICCHPTLEWTLFQGLESSIPHTILWIPTCALIWILHVTIIAFIFFPVRNNRVPP